MNVMKQLRFGSRKTIHGLNFNKIKWSVLIAFIFVGE